MQVKDFNTASELPIGSYCYVITRFLPQTISKNREYIDSHRIFDEEHVKLYRQIIELNYDFTIQYETCKLLGVKNDAFVVENMDEYIQSYYHIFLTKEDMEAFWEQKVSSWKKEKEETIQYIKTTYPAISKEAREQVAKEVDGYHQWTDEEKQIEIDKY